MVFRLWKRQPSLSLAQIISSHDTVAAHGVLIRALESVDRNTQYYAKTAGVGGKKTELSSQYFPKILALLTSRPDPVYVNLMARISSPQADAALWAMLSSNDQRHFSAAFDILRQRDEARLIGEIVQNNQHLAPHQNQRAIMLGRKLWEKGTYYNKRRVTDEDIDFYERLYVNSDWSQTSKLIPFTALTTMREQASSNDQKRLRNTKLARRLTRIDNILAKDEDVYMKLYFASVDEEIDKLRRIKLHNNIRSNEKLYFVNMLRHTFPPPEYIKTPNKWVIKMRQYLYDERIDDDAWVLDFLIIHDADTDFLKSFLLSRINADTRWDRLTHAILIVAKRAALRQNREIRLQLKQLENMHLFSTVRLAARLVLTDEDLNLNMLNEYSFVYRRKSEQHMIALNKMRVYCNPPREATEVEQGYLPEFPMFDYWKQYSLGANYTVKEAKRTPKGWLVGYNGGEFGGGLVYYPDGAPQGIILLEGTPHNVIRITNSNTKGVYWVLTGLNHMFDSGSIMHRVKIENGEVKSGVQIQMPNTPYKTFVTKNGDIFMDFWLRPNARMGENMHEKKDVLSKYKYNPPLLFTKNGELKLACEGATQQ